jgi:NitT/TauT family transport system ATP-binding protein
MIHIEKGSFGYDGIPVAGPMDLEVGKQEIVAIVGPSGCGKTTILRTISGAIPLLGGEIRLDGEIRNRQWLTLHCARTLQNFPLLHWLTVEGNLRLACKIRGTAVPDLDQVLMEFSALHLKHRYPKNLSGGERCRASLAQAVLLDAKVLLLDEPFSGLDLNVKEEISRYLFGFCTGRNASVLFVTHDLHDACEHASRVVVLNGGRPSRVKAVVVPDGADAIHRIRAAMLEAA